MYQFDKVKQNTMLGKHVEKLVAPQKIKLKEGR